MYSTDRQAPDAALQPASPNDRTSPSQVLGDRTNNIAQIPRAKSEDFLSQRLSSQKDPGCGPI